MGEIENVIIRANTKANVILLQVKMHKNTWQKKKIVQFKLPKHKI